MLNWADDEFTSPPNKTLKMFTVDKGASIVKRKTRNSMGKPTTESTDERLDRVTSLLEEISSQLGETTERIDKLEEDSTKLVTGLSKNGDIDCRFKWIELEQKKFNLILRGLPKHPESKQFETRDQTRIVIHDFFEFLEVGIELRDYIRLPDMKVGKGKKPGIIRIELLRLDDKNALFGALSKKGKESEIKGISVLQDLPFSFQKDFKILDKEAFELRGKEKVRTRIVAKGLQLVLQKRASANDKWIDVNKI